MKTGKIVIVDSGVGGVHILAECQKILPAENFVYIADTLNAPYGEKSKKKLVKIADDLVGKIIKEYNPKIIVLACNTLTVNAIKFLRKKYGKQVNFVGVEPALKQAKIYGGGETLILATPSTIKFYHKLNKKITCELKHEYALQKLKYSNDDKVTKLAIPNLAKKIDANIENLNILKNEIKDILGNDKFVKIKNVVIGCTHYIALQNYIKEILGEVKIFNGASAVAKRVQSLIKKNNKKTIGRINFISTSGNKIFENKLKKYYNLIKK